MYNTPWYVGCARIQLEQWRTVAVASIPLQWTCLSEAEPGPKLVALPSMESLAFRRSQIRRRTGSVGIRAGEEGGRLPCKIRGC